MDKPPSLSYIRRKQREEKNRLYFARALVAVFRGVFRCLEFVGPPKRQQKMRQFRDKMQGIEREKSVILEQIKRGDVSKSIDALFEVSARHDRPEDHAKSSETQDYILAIRQESEALQSIHKASGGDKIVAAQGFRDYITAHPDSSSAHSYLGGTLKQLGDLDGSIKEYHEAIQLAGSDTIPGAASRLHLGEVLSQKGEKEAAMTEFRHIIEEATPKTEAIVGMAFLQLGIVLNEVGERKQARATWKQAIQWDTGKIIAKRAQEMLRSNP